MTLSTKLLVNEYLQNIDSSISSEVHAMYFAGGSHDAQGVFNEVPFLITVGMSTLEVSLEVFVDAMLMIHVL